MSSDLHSRSVALDGIRGIAILSVVIYHATMTLGHDFAPIQALLSIGHTAWLGVEVFFALSGFLITRILLNSRHAPAREYFGTFYYRRALRIFPLYFGVLAVIWLVSTAWPSFNAKGAVRFLDEQWWFWLHAANMAREYYGAHLPALEFGRFELSHFWTLAVEEHFYLFWPLLVFTLSVRRIALVAVALVLVSLSLRSGLVNAESPWIDALVATPKYVAGLAVGGLAALWLHCRPMAAITPLARGATLVIAPIVFLACALTPIAEQGNVFDTVIALLAAITAACAALWVTTEPNARLARWLSNPVLVTYGKYSYGIYVFHYLLGPVTRDVQLSQWPGGYTLGIIWYVSLYLVIPLLVAIVSYHCWEAPWLKLKDRRSYRPGVPPAAVPAAPT